MKNKIIITAGGTSERIDNVRKITNSSSGKLGCTIAEKLIELKNNEIDKIYYICFVLHKRFFLKHKRQHYFC